MEHRQQFRNPIRHVWTSTVTASPLFPPPPRRMELSSWDLAMLNFNYIQKGHLFSLPSIDDALMDHILTTLSSSLSLALLHFYPLAGRLATTHTAGGCFIHVDCANQGAELTYAVGDGVAVTDVAGPTDGDLPSALIRLLFPCDGAINHDGHTVPLLCIQVTRLLDGIFLGCAFNHALGDGTSFWHFFNTWAEICRGDKASRPPVLDRWFPEGIAVPIRMPFSHPDEFVLRFTPPVVRERMFHFSTPTLAALKARAKRECGGTGNKISTFQALSALLWRTITRVRRLPGHQKTSCRLAFENRSRLRPPLSPDYFGNSFNAISSTTTVSELLEQNLGWAALLINQSVAAFGNEAIRGFVATWLESPMVYDLNMFDIYSVMMGSSPRFDMYGCDFGWGKAVALRCGAAHKFDGKVSAFPGWVGGGSIDLEVCLLPDYMRDLGSDEEFMAVVSSAV